MELIGVSSQARSIRGWVCCGLALLLWASSPMFAEDVGCRPMSSELIFHITEYLAQRITSESGGVPSLLSASLLPGTCYQKLLIQVSGTANPLTLYLSPDQRFLTSTLYDLAGDIRQEALQAAASTEKLLTRDESPRLLGSHSQIVLVEFGDLQCPFCKRFAEWYHALPPPLRDETTLIFKHLPLAQHSWAEMAARYSACANLQSTAAFWELSDYLLGHQDDVTSANLAEKVDSVLSRVPNVKVDDVDSCAGTEVGSAIVARDIAVAKELAVSRTPTLFIEGWRAPTPHSEEDLRLLLEHKLQGRQAQIPNAGK